MNGKRWLSSIPLVFLGVIGCIAADLQLKSLAPAGEVKSPVPNVDFSQMAIATRTVEATESGGTAKVQVKAQERCALGYATCDQPRPRTVEAVCLGSRTTVVIDEKDWPAFRRIPAEDLQGIENAPQDMRLCAAWER